MYLLVCVYVCMCVWCFKHPSLILQLRLLIIIIWLKISLSQITCKKLVFSSYCYHKINYMIVNINKSRAHVHSQCASDLSFKKTAEVATKIPSAPRLLRILFEVERGGKAV